MQQSYARKAGILNLSISMNRTYTNSYLNSSSYSHLRSYSQSNSYQLIRFHIYILIQTYTNIHIFLLIRNHSHAHNHIFGFSIQHSILECSCFSLSSEPRLKLRNKYLSPEGKVVFSKICISYVFLLSI